MAYQRKDGDGSLFQNTNKQKDTQPDYRGEVLLDGKTYEIAGWKKARQNGEPWLSLKVQPKRERPQGAQRPAEQPFNDEIPF